VSTHLRLGRPEGLRYGRADLKVSATAGQT